MTKSLLPPEDKERMDEFAVLARAELVANWKNWSVINVAEWWQRWCRFGKTNHDRLGRILLDVTGVSRRGKLIKRLPKE
jgi:hypothetical protein